MVSVTGGVTLALATLAALATACFQELDPYAATGPVTGDGGTVSADAFTSWELCQSPSCDRVSGEIPFLAETPVIYLPDGGTTTDPCVEVEQASMTIRQTYCAGCHASPAAQGGMGFVLDDAKLSTSLSTATGDAGAAMPLLLPGDPSRSYLYTTVARGLSGRDTGMPPLAMAGYPSIPRPSAADLSVLYAWIVSCAPGLDGGGYELGGGDYAPDGAPPKVAPGEGAEDAGTD